MRGGGVELRYEHLIHPPGPSVARVSAACAEVKEGESPRGSADPGRAATGLWRSPVHLSPCQSSGWLAK